MFPLLCQGMISFFVSSFFSFEQPLAASHLVSAISFFRFSFWTALFVLAAERSPNSKASRGRWIFCSAFPCLCHAHRPRVLSIYSKCRKRAWTEVGHEAEPAHVRGFRFVVLLFFLSFLGLVQQLRRAAHAHATNQPQRRFGIWRFAAPIVARHPFASFVFHVRVSNIETHGLETH